MKRSILLIFLIVVGCKFPTDSPQTTGIPRFTELKEGDRLHLAWETDSCLGGVEPSGVAYAYTSDYMVYNAPVIPIEDESGWNKLYKLSLQDKLDLDKLLDYWQGDIDTYGCTSSELLTVTYVHEGKVVCSETYVDSTGNECPISVSDILMQCVTRNRNSQK